jgi:uncharacterized phage protein gp47/JayE
LSEEILNRILTNIKTYDSTIDTREGSDVYISVAPDALELENLNIGIETMSDNTFADTASREYLIRRTAEFGYAPNAATYAQLKLVTTGATPVVGSRFTAPINNLSYSVISDGVVQCEQLGTTGNSYLGTVTPVEYISGLLTASITEVLIAGQDDEDTEAYRKRFMDSLSTQAYGGNIADYKKKTTEIAGVGGVKVYPIWNGGGTVKLVIQASDFSVPSQYLIDTVQNDIDPVGHSGQGIGIAPIGHVVTVVGCSNLTVNVQLSLSYAQGYDWDTVVTAVTETIDTYLGELRSDWSSSDYVTVRKAEIEARTLRIAGVVDVLQVLINGTDSNLELDADAIPIIGTVTSL